MTERNDIHDDGNNSYGEKKRAFEIILSDYNWSIQISPRKSEFTDSAS
jgi:hypothetical protein